MDWIVAQRIEHRLRDIQTIAPDAIKGALKRGDALLEIFDPKYVRDLTIQSGVTHARIQRLTRVHSSKADEKRVKSLPEFKTPRFDKALLNESRYWRRASGYAADRSYQDARRRVRELPAFVQGGTQQISEVDRQRGNNLNALLTGTVLLGLQCADTKTTKKEIGRLLTMLTIGDLLILGGAAVSITWIPARVLDQVFERIPVTRPAYRSYCAYVIAISAWLEAANRFLDDVDLDGKWIVHDFYALHRRLL